MGFCHPAGFGKRDDTCFLVVHPDKYAERFIYYFFTVSYYHTCQFLIGYEDTDFVDSQADKQWSKLDWLNG